VPVVPFGAIGVVGQVEGAVAFWAGGRGVVHIYLVEGRGIWI
jgi:hypothetical protein